jgi:hypothetical protein
LKGHNAQRRLREKTPDLKADATADKEIAHAIKAILASSTKAADLATIDAFGAAMLLEKKKRSNYDKCD